MKVGVLWDEDQFVVKYAKITVIKTMKLKIDINWYRRNFWQINSNIIAEFGFEGFQINTFWWVISTNQGSTKW